MKINPFLSILTILFFSSILGCSGTDATDEMDLEDMDGDTSLSIALTCNSLDQTNCTDAVTASPNAIFTLLNDIDCATLLAGGTSNDDIVNEVNVTECDDFMCAVTADPDNWIASSGPDPIDEIPNGTYSLAGFIDMDADGGPTLAEDILFCRDDVEIAESTTQVILGGADVRN